MKKKFLSAALAIALTLALLPLSALAAGESSQRFSAATGTVDGKNVADIQGTVNVTDPTEGNNTYKITGDVKYNEGYAVALSVNKTVDNVSFTSVTVDSKTLSFDNGDSVSFVKTLTAGANGGAQNFDITYTVGGDTSATGTITFDCSGLTLAEAPVETPTVPSTGYAVAELADNRPDEVKITSLYEADTYKLGAVTVSGSTVTIPVEARGLKAHQRGDTDATMGYWVGVTLPAIEGWTANTATLYAELDDTATHTHKVTYAKGNSSSEITYILDLTGVTKFEPKAPEASSNPEASTTVAADDIKGQISAAIAESATDVPTVTTEITAAEGTTLTSGAATVPAEAVKALKAGEVSYQLDVADVGGIRLGTSALAKIAEKLGQASASVEVKVAKAETPKTDGIPADKVPSNPGNMLTFSATVKVGETAVEGAAGWGTDAGIGLSFYVGTGNSAWKSAWVYCVSDPTVAPKQYSIDKNGYVSATVPHLSDYTLVMSEEEVTEPDNPDTTPVSVQFEATQCFLDGKVTVTGSGIESGKTYVIQISKGSANAVFTQQAGDSGLEFVAQRDIKVSVWALGEGKDIYTTTADQLDPYIVYMQAPAAK